MTKKRIKTLLLFAVFAICAMVAPQTAFAAEHTTIDVNNSQEFNDAVSTVNAAASGEYTIRLTNDIEGGCSYSFVNWEMLSVRWTPYSAHRN